MQVRVFRVSMVSTNCYLLWGEDSGEAMLIDPGAYEPAVTAAIEKNGLQLKYIALTHGHGDHICGVERFMEDYPDAVLAAGAKEAELLADPELNLSSAFMGKGVSLVPGLLLYKDDELNLGKLSIRVIETPGHTPGGLSFYVKDHDRGLLDRDFSGTAFSGDTLFQSSIGRTDLPGGDFSVLSASVKEELYCLPDDTLVLPGHMDVTTIGNEKKYNPFIK